MADVNITSGSTNTVDLVGLNDINTSFTLDVPQPIKTDGTNTYDFKPLNTTSSITAEIKPLKADLKLEPVKTDSGLTVDLKPVVLDLCLTTNVGKVPSLCIRQPYHHRIGFSLYNVEIWGFSFSGEQETMVEEMSPRPQIALGGATAWPPTKPAASAKVEPHATGSGLRIRLGP
jgi:hypothetical protein